MQFGLKAAAFIYPRPWSDISETSQEDWLDDSERSGLHRCARSANPLQGGSFLISLLMRVFVKQASSRWVKASKNKEGLEQWCSPPPLATSGLC